MWVFGLVAYYVFHLIAVKWYLGLYTKNSLERPMASNYPWFHTAIFLISLILLITSGTFFYLSSPWLVLAVLPLFAVSFLWLRIREGSRMNLILSTAASVQAKMEANGASEQEVIKAICLATTGKAWDLDWDGDVKSFLKYYVLRDQLSYDESEDFRRSAADPTRKSTSEKIDETFDLYYEKEKRTSEYLSRIKCQATQSAHKNISR
jgi:hypothetical protein